MAEPIVRAESAVDFFREQVEAACERQQVRTQPLTTYYIVSLLADFTHLGRSANGEAFASNEALGLKLVRALQSAGLDQRRNLKEVGDVSLFVSGFFSDSLCRGLVGVDYYVSLGGYAYGSLGAGPGTLAPVFAELSDRFLTFVDVLGEVSERTSLTSARDLLRLYDRWLRTGSRRSGELLSEQGIAPNESLRGSTGVH